MTKSGALPVWMIFRVTTDGRTFLCATCVQKRSQTVTSAARASDTMMSLSSGCVPARGSGSPDRDVFAADATASNVSFTDPPRSSNGDECNRHKRPAEGLTTKTLDGTTTISEPKKTAERAAQVAANRGRSSQEQLPIVYTAVTLFPERDNSI
jgi:hypothetical protein